jgi:hypothetical protein
MDSDHGATRMRKWRMNQAASGSDLHRDGDVRRRIRKLRRNGSSSE